MRTGSMRTAEVSLPAIRHNVRRIREFTGGQVIAVIKANGYGHGSEIAARAAIEGGAALLGVTDLEEALSLRDLGIDAPILCWLHGVRANYDAALEGGGEERPALARRERGEGGEAGHERFLLKWCAPDVWWSLSPRARLY